MPWVLQEVAPGLLSALLREDQRILHTFKQTWAAIFQEDGDGAANVSVSSEGWLQFLSESDHVPYL